MKISSPLCITSRLLPGCRIGSAELSIEYYCCSHNRQYYRWFIDIPEFSDTGSGLYTGIGRGTLQKGLESLLCFLGTFTEAKAFEQRVDDSTETENGNLFSAKLAEWAVQNQDAITIMELELQEHPGKLIVE